LLRLLKRFHLFVETNVALFRMDASTGPQGQRLARSLQPAPMNQLSEGGRRRLRPLAREPARHREHGPSHGRANRSAVVPINTQRLRPRPPHGLGQDRWSGFLAGTTPAELEPYQESPFQVQGDRPGSRVAELEAAIADRRAEYDASGRIYDEILLKRAEHVARNRDRLRRDVRRAIEKEAAEMRRHVDGLERTRQELLDLRRTEVWVGFFPSELLANERNTQAIAGARKAV
jgi:hypothetical protein